MYKCSKTLSISNVLLFMFNLVPRIYCGLIHIFTIPRNAATMGPVLNKNLKWK